MRTMHRKMAAMAIGIAAFTVSAAAQTVASSGTGTVGNVPYISANSSTSTTLSSSPISVSGSNVGIGTTNPATNLNINNGSADGGMRITNNNGDTWFSFTGNGYNYIRGTTIVADQGGTVGIGTANPGAELEVDAGAAGLPSPGLIVNKNYGGGGNNIPAAEIFGTDLGVGNTGLYIAQKGNGGFGGTNGFVWEAVSNGNPVMLEAYNGYVGIGTISPGAPLEVDGNVKLTAGSGASITFQDNTIQSTAWNGTLTGGDYAESVDVLGDRAEYEPGDVIVIDPAAPGSFSKSAKAYSRLVAGVFSTKPGLVGRRTTAARPDKDAEVPMAMMGIVPTKVSAENGPIDPGDLLVSASTPGYAMKGTDSGRLTGAVIGKALAPFKTGLGVIEVLVSLQ